MSVSLAQKQTQGVIGDSQPVIPSVTRAGPVPRVNRQQPTKPAVPPVPNSPSQPETFEPGTEPLGIRNNNPGNIRFVASNDWKGQIGSVGGFARFRSPEYGIRAMFILLRNDINAGKNTVRQLINEWAPPVENPTQNYVNFVSRETGLGADQRLTASPEILTRIAPAIVRFENGKNPYPPAVFSRALLLV